VRILAALALAGCAAPVHAVRNDLGVERLSLPAESSTVDDFAACAPGVAFVPVAGGVVSAGWQEWIILPSTNHVESVACDDSGSLLTIEGGKLRVGSGATNADRAQKELALPGGKWHVLASRGGKVWIYGRADGASGSRYSILSADLERSALNVVYSGDDEIRAAATIGDFGIAAILGERLVSWDDGATPTYHANLPGADGLAIAINGNVIVSFKKGILRLRGGTTEGAKPIALGVHGQLRLRGDVLYVLSHDGGASEVLRMTPTIGEDGLGYLRRGDSSQQ
jgi:hypothetical protein